MPIEDSEQSTSVIVGVIRDLTRTVEESKHQLETYEVLSTKERAEFKQSIEASINDIRQANEANIVQLRKDFQRALMPFLMENIDHRQVHKDALAQQQKLVDQQNADILVRTKRQSEVDRRFTILTIVLVVVAVLVVVLLLILILRIIVVSRT
jgi:hypothetical protein